MRLLTSILALLLATTALAQNTLTEQEKADNWSLLFDGKTLEGWTTSGELSAWGIEQDKEGPVLTMLKPGRGDWLRTTRMYRDFELLIDFDVAKGKNSGVGIRASSVGDPAFSGMEIQVFGNQGEKPTITCCGSVYDAITPVVSTPDGTLPLKDAGQWNTYRIKLVGDTLNIWLNGDHIHTDQKLDTRGYTHKPEAKNPLNSRCPTGYIALQDHGDKVRFRNIKIKDLSADKDPGGFDPLFNGKDTKGWTTKSAGENKWRVEDGVLIGEKGGLMTERTWKDAEFRAFVKGEKDAEGLLGLTKTDALSRFKGDVAWHDYRIQREGNKVQSWLDGKPVTDGPSEADSSGGQFILAARGGAFEFKDIQVRELTTK